MATILAANTGNWSATGTWTGGVVPVAGDIVVANGKTVTIDTLNVTVAEVRNDTTGGAVAGGGFNMVNGGSLTANIYAGTTGSCVTWAGTSGQTATVTGNIYAGAGTTGFNCTGGSLIVGGGSQVYGSSTTATGVGLVFTSSSGNFTFGTAGNPGNAFGSASVNASSYGMSIGGVNSTTTIYATTIASTSTGSAAGVQILGTNVLLNIIVSQINSVGSAAIGLRLEPTSINSNSSVVVSGTIYGTNVQSGQGGIYFNSGVTLSITHSGSCISQNAGPAIFHANGSGILNYTGNIVGNSSGSSTIAVQNGSTGTFNITGSVTAGNIANGATNASSGILRVTRAIGNGYGPGSTGIGVNFAIVSNTQGSLTYVEQLQFGSLGQPPFSGPIRLTANTGNVVQFTTTTGTTKTLVDTAATSGVLPAATDVRTGVVYSSGNLTGSCAVPAAGSVALGVPVDATTGTAVLTAANVRTAVGMASANLDTQLSSIPSSVWSAGTRTITGGTVDTLTNSPDVPTEAEIAAQVRTELSPELARVANCATVATTGQQIEDALNN